MDDAKWEKYAALGGVAFVVLSVVGSFIAGAPPAADDSAAEIAEWFADNPGAIQVSQFLNGLALIGLTWWGGSLFRKMARAEDGRPRLSIVVIVGLVFGGSFALVSGAIMSATALRIDEIGDGAQVFYTMSMVLLSTSAFGIVAALAAISALSLRTKMLPQWLTFLGWLVAVLFLIGSIGSATDSAAIGFFGFAGYLVWCIWILGVSFEMWTRPTTASASVPSSTQVAA
ncbi:MAG TPA: hypothetical protein VM282_08575 [Acidimicrobiales bacterium]|nr:hypothetical protein [Acidimicrobiales bacterium]